MSVTYAQKVARKLRLIHKHQMEYNTLISQCPHVVLEKKHKYCPGGYDFQASTDYWSECVVCKERFNLVHKSHGY